MTAVSRLAGGDWGTMRLGGAQVPTRAVVGIAGIAVWLSIAALLTGFDNMLAAFATNAAFVTGLVVLGSLTRTIGVLTVVRAFALGGLAMAVMLFLGQPLAALARDPASTVDPVAEELLKLTPLALLMWQGRRFASWQLGATDVVLIAVAAGAGFAVVEDAFIRMNEGWGNTLPFLPTTELYEDRIRGDRLIAGHAIWTALSGVTIGLAWLMVRFRAVLLVAPLGFLLATADHIGVNSGTDPLLGPLVIVLFLAGLAGVITADLFVLTRRLPSLPDMDNALAGPAPPLIRWRRALESRRLRYAAWRLRRRRSSWDSGAERAVRRSIVELVESPSG